MSTRSRNYQPARGGINARFAGRCRRWNLEAHRALKAIILSLCTLAGVGAARAIPAAPGGAIATRDAPIVVPITFEDGRVYVPVFAADTSATSQTAGGTVTGQHRLFLGWFIFDTGASETVLDAAVARQLGLETRDAGSEGGAGAGRTHEYSSSGVPLDVGTVRLVPKKFVVVPLDSMLSPSSGRHIAGIIGSQFFIEHVVELSAPWRSITVNPLSQTRAVSRSPTSVEVPLDLDDGIPFVKASIKVRAGPSQPLLLRLLVDLGAKAPLLVTEQALDRLGGTAALPPHVLASLGAGFGGETRYYFSRIARVTVGSGANTVHRDSVVVGFSAAATLRHTDFDGLMGTPFLSHYDVRIDYGHRLLTLTLPRHGKLVGDTTDFDMSGMFVASDLAHSIPRFFVRRIVDRSPAADADIQPGDELVSIDQVPTRELGLVRLRLALRRLPARATMVTLIRDGKPIVRTLHLRPQL